ncbi:hypothetical protein DB31_8792 [Hyalangium minutum]|uniref:Uncharacterized protein n=1 Tax=Hyalangium minutum TaxID=394096 RepID=A0A085WIC6_9BACT|nr:hypothetical protein DB31_8705 [Hyalangium minutum]KFE67439.1 hypothetical protein DB31_8792 [Hyalangium minutum]
MAFSSSNSAVRVHPFVVFWDAAASEQLRFHRVACLRVEVLG